MKNRKTLFIVFAIVLVDMLGVGILIPVIPLLLTDPSYPYYLGLSPRGGFIILGLLTAIYPFGQFIATPILGQLSDRFGRRLVLAFSLAGTAFSYALFAVGIMTKSTPLLFISRALDGVTGGNISVAQAAIADTTKPKDRAKSFGMIGAAFGIGFIIGPFLGGQLSNPELVSWFSATTPFWFAAILAGLNMTLVLTLFKETLAQPRYEKLTFGQSFSNVRRAFTDKALRPLFATSFLYTSGFTFFTTFFGVYLISSFAFTQASIGNFFALVGICIAVTQAVITGAVAKRWSSVAIIRASLFGLALTLLFYYLADAPWQLYLITLPNAMCIGLIMANLTSLISQTAPEDRQGEIFGINASVQALAQSIPPVIAGVVAARAQPGTPLLVAATLMLGTALFFMAAARRLHAPKGGSDSIARSAV